MRAIFTMPELLAMRSNAWGCTSCGQIWLETAVPGLWSPRLPVRDPNCPHPQLARTWLDPQ